MRRDLWLVLILGCLLILLLEAPATFASVTEDLGGPYPGWSRPQETVRSADPAEADPASPEQATNDRAALDPRTPEQRRSKDPG